MRQSLKEALADLDLSDHDRVNSILATHWELLLAWNDRTNLTHITDDQEAAYLHYRDSLELLSVLDSGPVLDIGSGGGFPGLPLAVARPDWAVTLMEPRRKRASFLQAAIVRLQLPNLRVVNERAEESPSAEFAAVVTRATFSDENDLEACMAWLRPGGKLIAFRAVDAPPLVGSSPRFYLAGSAERRLDICLAPTEI